MSKGMSSRSVVCRCSPPAKRLRGGARGDTEGGGGGGPVVICGWQGSSVTGQRPTSRYTESNAHLFLFDPPPLKPEPWKWEGWSILCHLVPSGSHTRWPVGGTKTHASDEKATM